MSPLEGEVLAANRAFYSAFTAKDVGAMIALWAAEHPVACIHPGWSALAGREQVVASWRAILESERAPTVSCSLERVHLLGDAAFVLCQENVGRVSLIATNIFVLEAGAWKLVHHHAAPLAVVEEDDDEPRVLN